MPETPESDRDSGLRPAKTRPDDAIDDYDLTSVPGHLLRRWQQHSLELYLQEVGEDGPTPRQFAAMVTIHQNPGLSQVALVDRTGIDRSTTAEMIERLDRRGMVRRERCKEDHRTNALYLTEEGRACISRAAAGVGRAQERILAPIPKKDRARFLSYLARIVETPAADGGEPAEDQKNRT